MFIAKIVGNVVSTIKISCHEGKKILIVQPLDERMCPKGERLMALDVADAGVGDIVLVNSDGGAAQMLHNDKKLIADLTICGVIDHVTFADEEKSKHN